MPELQPALTHEGLKTPRAAALAGILFALLYSCSMILIRLSTSLRCLSSDEGAEGGCGNG